MKITVIKKSGAKVNITALCPWVVDEPQVPKR